MLQRKIFKVNLRNTREREKRSYNQRIIKTENGSFTQLAFACAGGMSRECWIFYSHLADLSAIKKNKSTVMNYHNEENYRSSYYAPYLHKRFQSKKCKRNENKYRCWLKQYWICSWPWYQQRVNRRSWERTLIIIEHSLYHN